VSFSLPGGGQGQVLIEPSDANALLRTLPPGSNMEVVYTSAPPLVLVQQVQLGGTNATQLAPPVDIKVVFRDPAGNIVRPANAGDVSLAVRLPRLDAPPGTLFVWLVGIEQDGTLVGLRPVPSTYDPGTNTDVLDLAAGDLEGTLFLPASLTPAWVQNHDPLVHMWSGPTREARDFGFAGPQFTTFTVAAPQVTNRLFVYSPVVGNYGWIDSSGVGPSGPPQ
jgi:hypothetical protein